LDEEERWLRLASSLAFSVPPTTRRPSSWVLYVYVKRGKEGGRVTYRWNRLCSNCQVGHIKKLGHLGNDQYTATTTAKTKKDGVDKLNVSPVPAGPTCTQADACIHPPPE
jgi:hypothetical protein